MRLVPQLLTRGAFYGILAGFEKNACAFDYISHRRVVESAADVMLLTSAEASAPPAKVDPVAWSAFIGRMNQAYTKLGTLDTGLPAPPARVSSTCQYPLTYEATNREFDLANVGSSRIIDVPYDYTEAPPCYYEPVIPHLTRVGDVLGWHAASIDEHLHDQVLYDRPTSSFFLGLIQELDSQYTDVVLGALLLPFVCIAEFLESPLHPKCDASDAFDLGREVNPFQYVNGLIPGAIDVTRDEISGMFHFIDVDSSVNQYNSHRGLFYEDAGPEGHYPGSVDVLIMLGADLLGITLDPFHSDGVALYGQYDNISRTPQQWNAHNLGHTEMSPVSNLGQYGWDHFDGLNAKNLSWPLHAIGDSAEPHHIAGTTSWGHRPFEDAVANLNESLFPRGNAAPPGQTPVDPVDPAFSAMQARVLVTAFNALNQFDADPSFSNFILREAQGTREIAAAADDSWVYQDLSSLTYLSDKSSATGQYQGDPDRLRPFVEQAIAQTIAFLVKAGERSTGYGDPPAVPPENSPLLCPDNQVFIPDGCFSPPVESIPIPLPPAVLEATCSSDLGVSCQVAQDCCAPHLCKGGSCALACGGSEAACSSPSDCCAPLACNGGTCGLAVTCGDTGATCTNATDCCGVLVCSGGQCAAGSVTCSTSTGASCSGDSDCCTPLTCSAGTCVAPALPCNGAQLCDDQCAGSCDANGCCVDSVQ